MDRKVTFWTAEDREFKTSGVYLDAFACEAIFGGNHLSKLLHAADMRCDKPSLGIDLEIEIRLVYRHVAVR